MHRADDGMSGQLDRFRRADALFDAALDLPEAERSAYVERACGDDAALCSEVRALLLPSDDRNPA